jgi:predicted CXXCH cytochrome family protein
MRSVPIISKYFLLLLVLCILGCTVTEKRYKVLRIFFDGVPDPSQVKEETVPSETTGAAPKQRKEIIRVPMKSRHPDFVARDCSKCHNQASANYLNTKRDKICFSCHDSSDFQGKYLHGPMAAGDCLACHLPHESKYLNLLKAESAEMCFECHLREDIAANQVHEDVDLEKGMCTECHSPHASEDRLFLRI